MFVAPICNQLVASVMHGFAELGHTIYANRGWCCGVHDPACWRIPVVAEWNWCQFMSDDELLRMAQEPGVLVIGAARYASVEYWERETDGYEAQKAADVQSTAAKLDLIDAYIDDGDYDLVYPQMRSVQYYFKREPTDAHSVISLPFSLCPWLHIISPDHARPLLFSACFPIARRRLWDRLKTLDVLHEAFDGADDIWIGPVQELARSRRFLATNNRQGEQYLNVLQKSRCSLSLPGEGWDTFRFWEILSCGSCLISPRSVIENLAIDPPPRDGNEYLGFDTDDELVKIIQNCRNTPQRLVEIAMAGQQWAIAHHSSVNRAHKVLSAMHCS